MGELRAEQIGGGKGAEAKHDHDARIEMAQHPDRQRHQHDQRQRAVDQQQRAALLGTELRDRGEKIGDQRGVRQAGERVQENHGQRQADIAREQHVEMRPWLRGERLVDEKQHEQHGAAAEQRHHGAGLQPVEPVALVEPGIDHRNRAAEQQHAAPIGVAQQRAVDRLGGGAEIHHQRHQRRQHDTLPIQPLPTEMLDIEADQRG